MQFYPLGVIYSNTILLHLYVLYMYSGCVAQQLLDDEHSLQMQTVTVYIPRANHGVANGGFFK